MLWSETQSGDFRLSSVVKLLTPASVMSWVFEQVWVKGLPLKFSCLVWRLLQFKLPTSNVVTRFNVHGPSRCYYCRDHKLETLQHIFALGDYNDLEDF